MRKKCFKKAVSLALCIVMSVTMTGTPVLADTFTDGSQSISSENAEIPIVDAESATDCGDVASTEENLTEPALLQEEEFDNSEYVEFSGGNDAEAVSEFSDDSVPAAQTGGNTGVYLDPNSGNDTNDGKSETTAIKTLRNALTMAQGGTIYLLNPINIDEDVTLENVTLRPGRANLTYMLNVNASKTVILKNVKTNNLTPENSSCIFSENPIQVYGTLTIEETIEDGTEIGPFPGKSCIDAKNGSTVNLTGGTIQGNGQGRVEEGGGIYADHATVNMSGGTIRNQVAEHGGGIYATYATVNMSGGMICGNNAIYGGGIDVDYSSNVTLTGGSISNNISGQGAGVYLTRASNISMKEGRNGQRCRIINNKAETDYSQNKYGEGGGIYIANSGNLGVVIESGTISGNSAIKGNDNNGSFQGEEGGGIYAWNSTVAIKEGSELRNNNAGYRGGAICIRGGKSNPSSLSVEGGDISDNTAKEGGSGIFACNDITVNVSGGKIIGNTGENNADNMKESVIMLINPTTTTWGDLVYLNLSNNPEITGSVVLSNGENTHGFRIRVNSTLNVNEPIWVIPTDETQDSIVVEYENETAAEKYESQFCTKKNNPKGLVRDGNTLKWTNKLKVELITITDITNNLISKTENIYILSGKVINSNDIPAATNISGYKRTGWQRISGGNSGIWNPTSPITANMQVQEIWELEAPKVTIAKEKGCPFSGIQLTAQAQHTRNDITYSYEWYKGDVPINDKNEETLTVSEAGTYKVKVTATSPAMYQASAEQSVEIPVTDFEHSYIWKHDQTTHWRHCSVGNENTTPESHTFGDWTVTKQASIGVEGEKERTCTVCRYKETTTIPAIYIPSYPVTGIKVSPDTLTLTRKDETAQLTAEVIPSYADNTRVTWKSSDESVVTVDEKGKVTAVGNGTATITVTSVSGNYIVTVAVTVKIPVEIEKISIEAEKETLTKIGESTELKVKIEPENADAQKLIWKSDNEMIAAVDENGKVTAIGNGMAIITVTTEDGKNTASITITVKIPDEPVINKTKGFGRLKVRSVNQTKTSITLEWSKLDGVDGYFVYGNRCNTKTKTYRYQKLATITNGRTWTHKNLKKGTFYKYIVKAYRIVDGKKVVTDTSASIHVITQGGKYGIAKSVSVTKIGNKKNVSKITLKKGKTAQITAKEIKKDKKIRHHRNLCYESSDTVVATVTPEGLIQAVGKGTCTIWVYAQNGVYAALTVTVK